MQIIHGAKKGAKPKQPFREKTTATTKQILSILYGITEGEALMFGPNPSNIDIASRIFLDGTPIMSKTGEQLLDVEFDYRTGTLDQDVIEGVPSVTVTDQVGVEVKKDTPITRIYNLEGVTRYDIMMSIPQLFDGDQEGNSRAATVQFAIDVGIDGEPLTEYGVFTITEKITNGYTPMYSVEVPKANSHTIRIRKLTDDATSDLSSNTIAVQSIGQVIEVRLAYPATALLWLRFDAEQFSNIPKLELRFYGKSDILVPANYNPQTREYATSGTGTTNGVWDGTFKRSYTDNPVWIWLDLLLSRRYGLGTRITIDMVDKWELYSISKYCDELVSDGKGGTEPRFTCNNLYLNTAQDAFKVMTDISTIFRAQVVYTGTKLKPRVDLPRDPVHSFNLSSVTNVVYSSVAASNIYNIVHCHYFDKNNKFEPKVVTRSNIDDIKRTQRHNALELTAVGCCSQSQAERAAEYILQSGALQLNMVNFTTGLEGFTPKIGDVFYLPDSFKTNTLTTGRLRQVRGTMLELDKEPVGDIVNATIVVNTGNDIQTATVVAVDGMKITTDVALETSAGLAYAITKDGASSLAEYTIVEMGFNETSNTWDISGLQYSRAKYPNSDNAATGGTGGPEISVPDEVSRPAILTSSYAVTNSQDRQIITIDITWAAVTGAVGYELEMMEQQNTSAWVSLGQTTALSWQIANASEGTYVFRIRAVNSVGSYSRYTTAQPLTVVGNTIPPAGSPTLTTRAGFLAISVDWTFPSFTQSIRSTLLQYTDTPDDANSWQSSYLSYPTNAFTLTGLDAADTWSFRAALVDTYGLVGEFSPIVTGQANSDVESWLPSLDGKISRTSLTPELAHEVDTYKVFNDVTNVDDMKAGALERKSFLYATSSTDILGTSGFDGIVEWIGLGGNKGMQVATDKTSKMRTRMFVGGVPTTGWIVIS